MVGLAKILKLQTPDTNITYMKTTYGKKPERIASVGNGSYYYHWNITEEIVDTPNMTNTIPDEKTQWTCNRITTWSPLTKAKITEAVIAELYGDGAEAKLINNFNAANADILPPEKKQPYLDYLNQRKVLKVDITTVCDEYNIK